MIPRADERPRTIGLKWNGMHEEGRAVATGILPGYLIELTDAEDDVPRLPARCIAHNNQGVQVPFRIALEDRLGNKAGQIQGKNIDTPYEEDDIVFYVVGLPGDVFQVRVAPQSTWTIGTQLCSAGDGTFEALAGGDIALCEVEENIDFSDVAGSDEPLVRVRVL